MHHSRRKSGHGSSSTTDVRKAATETSSSSSRHKSSSSSRPSAMTRKTTQVTGHKSSRDREREREDEHWWEEERESFPQYCMSCEKQFVPVDDRFLYCSEACRLRDHTTYVSASGATAGRWAAPSLKPAPHYPEQPPADLIPRASPSMYYSPPTTPGGAAAINYHSSLRSMSLHDSPSYTSLSAHSPNVASATYHHPGSAWPSNAAATTASPSTSYSSQVPPASSTTTTASAMYPSTYDAAYYDAGAGAGYNGNYGGYSGYASLDNAYVRRRPTQYSRPKSIELVTPMVGR